MKKKICFPSTGESLDSKIDSRFGRCAFFVVVEVEDGKILNIESEKNNGINQNNGVGISAVEQISKMGANVLITEDLGPRAQNLIEQLNIEVLEDSGIIKEALERYLKNN
jgi:predicted Fe-Mo cluster-binding NifX family protein